MGKTSGEAGTDIRSGRGSSELKIAFIAPSFHPVLGGVELYVQNLGKEFVSRGREVHVVTPDSVMGRRLKPRHEVVDDIQIHRVKTLFDLSYRAKLWPSLMDEIQRIKPDIVHVYSHDFYSFFALVACKRRGIPILITTYGPFLGQSEKGAMGSSLLNLYDNLLTPQILRNVTAINVRYPELSEWLYGMKIPKDVITLEPSAIPSDFLRPADGSSIRKQIGQDSKIVLYIGRLSKQKGIRTLLEACKIAHHKMDDIRLVLLGPEVGDLDLSNLPPWVHKLGSTLSSQYERSVIAASDLFVMPSRFEGFSQAVMKSIAQGKMVVATDVGGLPYELGYGKFGKLVEFGNVSMLAEAISKHFLGPVQTETSKNRDYAAQFTYSSAAPRILDQYDHVVSSYS